LSLDIDVGRCIVVDLAVVVVVVVGDDLVVVVVAVSDILMTIWIF